MENYYREKIIRLVESIFLETGDARARIINCEEKIESAFFASRADNVPNDIKLLWDKYWNELNQATPWYDHKGRLIQSSLAGTILRKRNKSMEKYFHFFIEEFYRVL